MNIKFFDLPREKQDVMMNGAMKVFAMHGYRHASTDDMVKEAGISKGLWFHYFGSKRGLYSFVYDYCMKYMDMEIRRKIGKDATNFWDIQKDLVLTQISVMRTYPYIQLFLLVADEETDPEALAEIEGKRAFRKECIEGIMAQCDWSSVHPKIIRSKVEAILGYTVYGLYKKNFEQGPPYLERFQEELLSYLEMLAYMTQENNINIQG